MLIEFDHRPSDSSVVDRVWRSRSSAGGVFSSIASVNWEIVVSRHEGRRFITVRGPETRASAAACPAEGEWFGIRFRLGTSFLPVPLLRLRDRRDIHLPELDGKGFLLDGSKWEYPTFENAETFVKRLLSERLIGVRAGLPAALHGRAGSLSESSVRAGQREFLRVTGITQERGRQIARARRAAIMLRDGAAILDVVRRCGYYDQPHLTRAFSSLIGVTPARVARADSQLSLLYKTGDA